MGLEFGVWRGISEPFNGRDACIFFRVEDSIWVSFYFLLCWDCIFSVAEDILRLRPLKSLFMCILRNESNKKGSSAIIKWFLSSDSPTITDDIYGWMLFLCVWRWKRVRSEGAPHPNPWVFATRMLTSLAAQQSSLFSVLKSLNVYQYNPPSALATHLLRGLCTVYALFY